MKQQQNNLVYKKDTHWLCTALACQYCRDEMTINTPEHNYDVFHNIHTLKAANKAAGQYFFSPDTMHFFDSRIGSVVRCGCVFITSERFHGSTTDGPRLYTLRYIKPDGSIDQLVPFQSFDSANTAWAFFNGLVFDTPRGYRNSSGRQRKTLAEMWVEHNSGVEGDKLWNLKGRVENLPDSHVISRLFRDAIKYYEAA